MDYLTLFLLGISLFINIHLTNILFLVILFINHSSINSIYLFLLTLINVHSYVGIINTMLIYAIGMLNYVYGYVYIYGFDVNKYISQEAIQNSGVYTKYINMMSNVWRFGKYYTWVSNVFNVMIVNVLKLLSFIRHITENMPIIREVYAMYDYVDNYIFMIIMIRKMNAGVFNYNGIDNGLMSGNNINSIMMGDKTNDMDQMANKMISELNDMMNILQSSVPDIE